MSSKRQKYAIRYSVEPWNKVIPAALGRSVAPGVRMTGTNYGYTDAIFLASIIKTEDGKIDSIVLMDSESGAYPSRDMLLVIKAQIEHHLECHLPK